MATVKSKFKIDMLKHRRHTNAGWYHETSATKTTRVFFWDGQGYIFGAKGNLFGPFDHFSKAKEHAMQVHRVNYQKARTALRNLKKLIKPKDTPE